MQSKESPATAVVVLAVLLSLAVLGLLVSVGDRGDGCVVLPSLLSCSKRV